MGWQAQIMKFIPFPFTFRFNKTKMCGTLEQVKNLIMMTANYLDGSMKNLQGLSAAPSSIAMTDQTLTHR